MTIFISLAEARDKFDLVGGVLLDLGEGFWVTDYESAVEDRGQEAIDALHPHYDDTRDLYSDLAPGRARGRRYEV